MVEPYRRSLELHCYRMLGSIHDAEDVVQETFLRAWRAGPLRAPLLGARPGLTGSPPTPARRARPPPAACPQPAIDPFRTTGLPGDEGPAGATRSARMEIAFLTAIQRLPGRQRAVLILRDLLAWSRRGRRPARLQPRRGQLRPAARGPRSTPRSAAPSPRARVESVPLRRYVDAWEEADIDGLSNCCARTRCSPCRRSRRSTGAAIVDFFVRVNRGSACAAVWANGRPAVLLWRHRLLCSGRGDRVAEIGVSRTRRSWPRSSAIRRTARPAPIPAASAPVASRRRARCCSAWTESTDRPSSSATSPGDIPATRRSSITWR